MAEAFRRRPLLSGDVERIGAAKARTREARSDLLPHLDFRASASTGPVLNPPSGLGTFVGTPTKKQVGASLNLIQVLLDSGRTHNTVRARRAQAKAIEQIMQADQNRVALDVQQAYLQALQAQRLLDVNQQILEQRRLVAKQAATLMENGFRTRVDVDLAELSVSQGQLAVVRSQNDIETAYAALSTAMGRVVPVSTRLQDVAPAFNGMPVPNVGASGAGPRTTPPGPGPASPAPGVMPSPSATRTPALVPGLPNLATQVTLALRARPEVLQLQLQVEADEHLVSAAKAQKRPLLTGVARLGHEDPASNESPGNDPLEVGVVFTQPLFSGGLFSAQIEEARHNASAARQDLNELQDTVRQQVTNAISNLAAAQESIVVAQAQLVRAQDALSLATQRYESQLGSIVELTQAQVGYATAQNDYVRAIYDQELARAALAYTTGSGYVGK